MQIVFIYCIRFLQQCHNFSKKIQNFAFVAVCVKISLTHEKNALVYKRFLLILRFNQYYILG